MLYNYSRANRLRRAMIIAVNNYNNAKTESMKSLLKPKAEITAKAYVTYIGRCADEVIKRSKELV